MLLFLENIPSLLAGKVTAFLKGAFRAEKKLSLLAGKKAALLNGVQH